jgi:hypothetical protein
MRALTTALSDGYFALHLAFNSGRRAKSQFADDLGSSTDARLASAGFIRHKPALSTTGTELESLMMLHASAKVKGTGAQLSRNPQDFPQP